MSLARFDPLFSKLVAEQILGSLSKSTPSALRGTPFWVHDVCASLLLAEMLAVLQQRAPGDRLVALAGIEHDMRVHTVVADLSLPLDERADVDEQAFLALIAAAVERLAAAWTPARCSAAR